MKTTYDQQAVIDAPSREAAREALEDRMRDIKPAQTEKWHNVGAAGEPAFQNSNSNVGGARTATRFKKIGTVVFIELAITGGTAVQPVFTLPAGYRPSGDIEFPSITNGGQIVTIHANGNVDVAGTRPVVVTFSFPSDQ